MISIIVPTLNRPYSLVKTLDSIFAQQFPQNEIEILVVFNFPPQISPAFFQPLHSAPLRILTAAEPGVNNARNMGILEARGDILLFVDDDVVLDDPLYLKKLKDLHTQFPEQMSIGGPYALPLKAKGFWQKVYHHISDHWMNSQKLKNDFSKALLGGNASYKKNVFSRGLRFPSHIVYGGSETPFNRDVFQTFGPHLFRPDLAVAHDDNLGLFRFVRKAYLQGRGAAFLFASDGVSPQATGTLPHSTWPYQIYDFVFTVGFRSAVDRRRLLPTALKEAGFRISSLWRSFSEDTSACLRRAKERL
ncbi:MAG: glycosyltransferase family 2 protein [Bdellovibrionales bacterium]|nr:glycosyltransferase family 2 protein [Bdellovibrionales bacterium]